MTHKNVLDEILNLKRQEIERHTRQCSLAALKAFATEAAPAKDFFAALSSSAAPRIIAECKKKSPSKGVLVTDYDPLSLARKYERGGAAAISVLTDEPFFGGSLQHLSEVSGELSCPVLRKDFIIDEYQIYEARRFGASSFLLLANCLDVVILQYYIEIGRELGMEPLVEVHDGSELSAVLRTDAKIIGINNRDLKSMRVNPNHAFDLLASLSPQARKERIFVLESGVKDHQEISRGMSAGFSAFLVGESLVTATDPEKTLIALRGL